MQKTVPLTLAQVQCFQSPVRVSMYAAMRSLGECSIRELAQHVGSRPDALYYHMRLLVDAELAENLEPRDRNGRKEAMYAIKGGPYEMDMLLGDAEYREAAMKSMQSVSRHSMRTLQRAIDRGEDKRVSFHWINAKLKPATFEKVLKKLNELIMSSMKLEEGDEAERVMIFAVAAPVMGKGKPKSKKK